MITAINHPLVVNTHLDWIIVRVVDKCINKPLKILLHLLMLSCVINQMLNKGS